MGKPHFKVSKAERAAQPAPLTADEPQGEVVIRADRVVLGSSLRRRLRVVCFETPENAAVSRQRSKS